MEVKVSVIIPVYNGEKYLRRALDSVVYQTYSESYEILLIDDGSTDTTAEICKEYVEQYKFVHYYHQENKGLARSRDVAIGLSKGEYICWLDVDDHVSTDLLKITMQKIEETGADICLFSWQGFFEDGRTVNNVREEKSVHEWKKQTITGEVTTVWSYICKKDLWVGECSPWQVWKCGEDAYMTPILFHKAKKIVSTPQVLYYYKYDNPESITNTYSGIKLLGSGYVNFLRFKMSVNRYPDIADKVGNNALRLLTRAYSVSAYLKDLDREKTELIRNYVLETAEETNHLSFRNAYRVILIRYRLEGFLKIIGWISCKKKKRQTKKSKKI